MTAFSIDGHTIAEDRPPFIIAEVGINHNGDVERALEMVRVAKAAGADAVKFQTFRADELVGDRTHQFTYKSQGHERTESMHAMFARNELPAAAWPVIKAACDREGIIFFSTPQNRSDLALLLAVGIPAIKVGSDDFVNLPLLRSFAETGLPLILSCGMSTFQEVERSLRATRALEGNLVAVLLCTSQYPTPPQDVHLRKLRTLRAAFPELPLGFSDHTVGPLAASLALAMGARIFEKHFTLSKELPGPDHWFSENPQTLQTWVESIRTAYTMLGSAKVEPTATERGQLRDFRRVIVAARPIAAGEAFSPENLTMRRDPKGRIAPAMYDEIIGTAAKRAFASGEPIEL